MEAIILKLEGKNERKNKTGTWNLWIFVVLDNFKKEKEEV